MRHVLLTLSFILFVNIAFSLKITEIMYNPASYSDTSLEWIEIFNDSNKPLIIKNWTIDGKSFSISLEAYGVGVLARKLINEKGDSFESVYGNGSGVWGDNPSENFPAVSVSLSFSNSGDNIKIRDENGVLITECSYKPSVGGDGNDKTIEVYNTEMVESEVKFGTPGKIFFSLKIDFNISLKKRIFLKKNEEIIKKIEKDGDTLFIFHLENGNYSLSIEANGYKNYETDFRIENDNKTLSVVLEETPKYILKGKIVCDAKDKVASIFLYENNNLVAETFSNEFGEFQIDDLLKGTYILRVEKKDYEIFEKEIFIDKDSDIAVMLVPLPKVSIKFYFVDEHGDTINDVSLFDGANLIAVLKSGDAYSFLKGENRDIIFKKDGYFLQKIDLIADDDKEFNVNMASYNALRINEIDFLAKSYGVEWVELKNMATFSYYIENCAVSDACNHKSGKKEVKITDYLILTGNKEKIEEKLGRSDERIVKLTSFPTLNNDKDAVLLYSGNVLLCEKQYAISEMKDKTTTLEYSGYKDFYYPSFEPTPLLENSIKGFCNANIKIKISEVYPFTSDEYVELYVEDDGNSGKGAILEQFSLTDFDTTINLSGIYKKSEIILIDKLSLNDDGDQIVLMRENKICDAVSYRYKYANLSEEEQKEFEKCKNFPLLLYRIKDYTKSFNRFDNRWYYTFLTKGKLYSPSIKEKTEIFFSKRYEIDKNMFFKYDFSSLAEMRLYIFDLNGIKLYDKTFFLSGKGEKEFFISDLMRGRYIFYFTLRQGERNIEKKGTFIVF